jgi:hypothetical protein
MTEADNALWVEGFTGTADRAIWPDFIPFGQGSGLWLHLLVLLGVLLALVALVPRGVRAAGRRWSPSAIRYRREVAYTAGVLGHGFVQYLGHLDASDVFRTSHVNALMRDWKLRNDALARIVDQRMSAMHDILASKEPEVWTPDERAEFCFRYRTPLAVLFSQKRREWMFQNAELSFTSDGKRFYPTLINLGHTLSGMTVTFHSEPFVTLSLWKKALPVLASALDSPTMEVSEVSGGQFILFLNDVDRRNTEMRALDEYRLRDRIEDAEDLAPEDDPNMPMEGRIRKNEMFARIDGAGRSGVEITPDSLAGLWFTPSEAVRVLNQVFDYETASWAIRNIGNYRMLPGEYLWTAVETVRGADEESDRAGGVLHPRAGSVDSIGIPESKIGDLTMEDPTINSTTTGYGE